MADTVEDLKTIPGTGNRPQRVGLSTKIFLAIGSLPYGVKDVGVSAFLLIFYNQVVGLPASLVGAALMFALIADSLLDPTIGYISDNWRSRLGRRHPFLYTSAALIAIFYILLWTPPLDWPQPAQLAYLTIMIVAVRFVISMYEVPNSAMTPEFTENYDERTSLMGYQYMMAYAGGAIGTLTAYKLFLQPDATHAVGQLNPNGYKMMAIAHGVFMMVVMFASALGTQGHVRHLRQPAPRPKPSLRQIAQELRETLSNRSLLMLMGAGAMGSLALGISGGTNVYLMTFLWKLSSDQMASVFLFLFVGVGIGVLLASPFGRLVGKRTAVIVIGLVYIVVHAAPVVGRLTGFFPVNGSPMLVPALSAFMCASTTLMVMYSTNAGSMLADVVEDSEVETGRRAEGVIFAAKLFMQKCVSGLGIFAAGMVLTAISFPANAKPDEISTEMVHRLAIAVTLAHGAFYLLGLLFMAGYQITRARHSANLLHIANRETAARDLALSPTPASEGRETSP